MAGHSIDTEYSLSAANDAVRLHSLALSVCLSVSFLFAVLSLRRGVRINRIRHLIRSETGSRFSEKVRSICKSETGFAVNLNPDLIILFTRFDVSDLRLFACVLQNEELGCCKEELETARLSKTMLILMLKLHW